MALSSVAVVVHGSLGRGSGGCIRRFVTTTTTTSTSSPTATTGSSFLKVIVSNMSSTSSSSSVITPPSPSPSPFFVSTSTFNTPKPTTAINNTTSTTIETTAATRGCCCCCCGRCRRMSHLSSSYSPHNRRGTTRKQFISTSSIRDDDSTTTIVEEREDGRDKDEDEDEDEDEKEEVDESNRRTRGHVILKKTTDGRGWGVFADRSFQPGEVVMQSLALETSDEPTSHTIQTDWKKHVTIDLPARFVNHRCSDANVGIQPNRWGAYNFIALRHIQQGDEVLWDYAASEYQVKETFTCNCGSPNCRGTMKGYKFHGNLVEECYGKQFIAPYLYCR